MMQKSEKLMKNNLTNNLRHAENDKQRLKGNWKQRLLNRRFSSDGQIIFKKEQKEIGKVFKKSLLYVFFLKKILSKEKSEIEYFNLTLLKIFLTKYGKIKARRRTRIKIKDQRKIARCIRRARIEGLLPFTTKVIIKKVNKKKPFFAKMPAND